MLDFDKVINRRGTGSLKWDVGEEELPMWVADMDFQSPLPIRNEILKIAERGIFGYSVTPDEYFTSISSFFERRFGYRFDPSHMVFCTGVVAAVSSLVRKLTTPAENVLIQTPVYNIFYNCILNNGRVPLENPLICKNGEWEMDFEDLEKKLSMPQTSLMILCNPQNPVGRIWTKEELCRVGELCHKYGVTVISDEIHCPITTPGKTYVPFASVSKLNSSISFTCVSASKAFNIAGLCAACVIAEDPVLRHKAYRGINTDEVGEPNVFAVSASVAAFSRCDDWLDGLNDYIYENKKLFCDIINREGRGLKVKINHATYLVLVDIRAFGLDSDTFAELLREKTGLYLSSGAAYGPGGEGYLRVNLAAPRSVITEGAKRLISFVSEL